GWANARANASALELLEVARPHLERARIARIGAAVARWREERGRKARASAGWAETLPAASDGRVDLLLLGEGADRKAYRCPRCGRGEVAAGSCPLDGTQLEPDAGSDIVVQQTLIQGGSVATVPVAELDDAEGVGA